jgi:hypothetical protein
MAAIGLEAQYRTLAKEYNLGARELPAFEKLHPVLARHARAMFAAGAIVHRSPCGHAPCVVTIRQLVAGYLEQPPHTLPRHISVALHLISLNEPEADALADLMLTGKGKLLDVPKGVDPVEYAKAVVEAEYLSAGELC